MSILLKVDTREIAGRQYQIRALGFGEARKVYSKIQRLLAAHGDEAMETAGMGLFMFAGLAGLVSDDDLKLYCEVFGKATVVVLEDNRTLPLLDEPALTNAFAGRFEDMFGWLDACVDVNFGGVLAKMHAARDQLKSRAAKS